MLPPGTPGEPKGASPPGGAFFCEELSRYRGVQPFMKSEINVTPIIDVMLVLLILFMIVTPLTQTGHDVTLPESAEPTSEASGLDYPVLEIGANGDISVNGRALADDELPSVVRQILETRADKSLFLKADGSLRYGRVVSVLDVARGNGAQRIGIVSP